MESWENLVGCRLCPCGTEITSEKEVTPRELADLTVSPTLTWLMSFTSPDGRETVSDAVKQEEVAEGVGSVDTH